MHSRKVVVIDDDDVTLEAIEKILEVYGFIVFPAHGGREGIELVRRTQPDIVLCDVIMPEVSGLMVLTELRKHTSTATIPVLMLSARHDHADIRAGMQLGADDFLSKPISVEDLLSSINTRLERHEHLVSNATQQLQQLRLNIALVLPHEFRTPLNSIIGFGELLAGQYERLKREEVMEMLATIVNSGHRLSSLVENFIYLSRLEILAVNPIIQKELLADTVQNCQDIIKEVAYHQVAINANQHHLESLVDNAPLAISDSYLRKLMVELVDNACKFSLAKSNITIRGRVQSGMYALSVQDEGRGMDAAHISQIGAYMQFDRNIHEQQGQGLGLTIAKRITELHSGSFTIDSTVGKGTTIELQLPLSL
jgi:two-component system, sensor histidine kinase and response regulator